jgi:hypothetical protein
VDTNRSFQFQKRSQLFIGSHDEPFSVAAMREKSAAMLARR